MMSALYFFLLVGSCLGQTQIERNVMEAMKEAQNIVTEIGKKAKTMPNDKFHMISQKASKDSHVIGQKGDWLLETTKVMVKKYGMGILKDLEKVNVDALMGQMNNAPSGNNRGKRQSGCPQDDTNCGSQTNTNYRTVTGVCNNRQNRNFGKGLTPVRRLLNNASFEDGIGSIRTRGVTGAALPSARDISNRLHSEGQSPVFDQTSSHMFQQFAQMIAHDIMFSPVSTGPNGEPLDCSACSSDQMSPNCAPIRVPNGDPYFPPNTCLPLIRLLNGQNGLGQRIQLSQNTHFLDSSEVYGSEPCEAASVRSFRNGELREFRRGQITLPPQLPNDTNCQSPGPNHCFLAGDFRNSLHPGLIPMHSVYIKIHNLIAQTMRIIRPQWNDEQTFQEARRVNIALYQHHVYSEYLPKLLGAQTMREFGLMPQTSGYFTGYDPNSNAALTAEFNAGAFRFGHSQIRKDIPRMTNDGRQAAPAIDLGSTIFYADGVYDQNGNSTESMLDGMLQTPAMAIDKEFAFPVRNQMFELRGRKASGTDLVSTNIMRGRDAGLFPYNVYRVAAGLPRANNWDDLRGQMDQTNINALRNTYVSVDDVDLYSGMLYERPANGAMLGRTGAYIVADGFRNLKIGDRFYYENQVAGSRSLTPDELAAIRRVPLSKLLCMTTLQMGNVNRNALDHRSPRVSCASLPNLDLRPFMGQAVGQCLATGAACTPTGVLGNCCSGYCYQVQGQQTGVCQNQNLLAGRINVPPCDETCRNGGNVATCCRAQGNSNGYCEGGKSYCQPQPAANQPAGGAGCLEIGRTCTATGSLGRCCSGFCYHAQGAPSGTCHNSGLISSRSNVPQCDEVCRTGGAVATCCRSNGHSNGNCENGKAQCFKL